MSFFIDAEAKLRKDSDPNLYDNIWDKTIAPPTAETLIFFCRKSDKFAEAVVKGDSFKKCIAKIAKDMDRHACSDFAVFNKAVEFYLPGARVEGTVDIILPDDNNNIIQLDLLSLLS